jgi:glycosyltransferase involved in cell wall biosynthesis
MKPIKIAVDVRDLRIAKTGVKTYTDELIKAFKKSTSTKIEFVYLDTSFPVYTGRNKLFKLIEHIRFTFWKQILLPLKAKINSCDIIFCADFFVPYFKMGMKTVPVLHDAFFFEYPEHYNKIWLFLFRFLGLNAARKADMIITPTNYTKHKIAALSGLSEKKITVIYEGPKSLTTLGTEDLSLENSLSKQRYILHVGVMEKRKNIINLLKAYLMMLKVYPDIKLILVGQFSPKKDMDDQRAIKTFIEDNHLTDNVILPGYVSDDTLIHYYKNALMYVFPSVNEGFGIPVLEAFEHGLPVLIANNSCLPEVAENAALSFDPYNPIDIYDKIKMILEDDSLSMDLIKKGYERLKFFSWASTAKQTIHLFEKIIVEKKP